ncbi:MAG: cytochrome c oxidase subunit I [Actinomycetota bacterium]
MATLAQRLEAIWTDRPGIAAFVSTVDHKRIGMRYFYTGMFFFVLGGIEALIMRVQLTTAELDLVNPEAFNQLFSMHGITMMFLFAMPVLSGFGNFFVPLMIGARDMAFPRLNSFGYWVFLAGGLFMYSAFLTGDAPNDGWFNYLPLGDENFTPGLNIDFYALGLLFLGISTTGGAVNFIVTIFKLRAPGMTLNRIPIFVWGELAMAFQIVFAVPLLTLACVMLVLDRKFGFHFFDNATGGDPLLWQHLFWIFGHPEVYIIVLPAFGIASAVIPTHVRRRMVGYIYIVLAELGVALIGFGVWVHHMFATGLPQMTMAFVSAASFMVAIPSGVQVFAWLATLVTGRPRLNTAMWFIFGFIATFVIGGVTGVMTSSIPFDQQVHDTYFVVAHLHYVLVGGAVFPMFAAIYHWAPKMIGRILHEGLGKLSFWLIFIGFNANMFPLHTVGILGQPRRVYTYEEGLGWDVHNIISTAGAFVLALGILVIGINWFRAMRKGPVAPDDPWNGETLEWATSSPPPHYNFRVVPVVTSREPVWDQPELKEGGDPSKGYALDEGHTTLSTSLLDGRPQALMHMPHASPWPFMLSIALFVFFYAVLLEAWSAAIAGFVLVVAGIMGWFWPRGETQET